MGKVIGIDLGTTNSCVAVLEGGKPVVITNAEGGRTTPSIVGFAKNNVRLVGQLAKRQAVTNAENTIFSIKRFIGRTFAETEEERKRVPYKVIPSRDNMVEVVVQDRAYTPQEISAMILQKLKADAEAYLGEPVTQAVITVPAYFTDAQRQATKDAGTIAGLEVLRIINEPTAAALAYGLDKQDQDLRILVFDLGGGTFDVSVLQLGSGVFEVQATAGNNHLGGDDFDQRIVDWLNRQFLETEGIDLSRDRMALQRMREAAEKAKIELSSTQVTLINLPFITADDSGPKHLEVELTRAKFEELVQDLVEATVEPTEQALRDAGLSPEDIDRVLLVGGSTRIPAVQEKIRRIFKKKPGSLRQPRRGSSPWRSHPGRGGRRRSERPAAVGCDSPLHWRGDLGRGIHPHHRAQHHHSHQQNPNFLHRHRRPDNGGNPRLAGRAGYGQGQQDLGPLSTNRDPASSPRGAPDRSLL